MSFGEIAIMWWAYLVRLLLYGNRVEAEAVEVVEERDNTSPAVSVRAARFQLQWMEKNVGQISYDTFNMGRGQCLGAHEC